MNADLWNAIILGILQGLTEFLPVSSSGHLELGRAILGTTWDTNSNMMFTVAVHGATALATVVTFQKDIRNIIRGFFKGSTEERHFALAILISMVPAAFVGLFFNDVIEMLFDQNIFMVAVMLIITGLLLFLADRAKKTHKKVSYVDAAVIGIAQAIAILPGISRSGATISTSVLLGIDRDQAARFSFLMVVPLILGKMIVDSRDLFAMPQQEQEAHLLPLLAGFLAAFVTGLWACKLMINLVKKAKLSGFAIYCIAVGTLAAFWVL
ncbi:MAG: UDP-diphosphatase [Cryomorphaceae bacterium BACL7 MAG-121220-bin83]|jgi:undecaprenyl-diphosphatase|nr:MAG: UDP-diphosphatase [Cryomorphaceae bacterium BACL7 MAG-121220-bin83]